jgi:hypothetical protein
MTMKHVVITFFVVVFVFLNTLAQASESSLINLTSYQARGTVTDARSGQILYYETHEMDARRGSANVNYLSPEGDLFGKKQLDFTNNPFCPEFNISFNDNSINYGISHQQEAIELYYIEESRELPIKQKYSLVCDAGFDLYVKSLLAPDNSLPKSSFEFALAPILDSLSMRIREIPPKKVDEKFRQLTEETCQCANEVIYIEAKAKNPLVRLFAPPLYLAYSSKTNKLLAYYGISNVIFPDKESPEVFISYTYIYNDSNKESETVNPG